MKIFKVIFVAMFLIMAMFISACGGSAVVKRINQDKATMVQTTTTTTTPQTTTTRVETQTTATAEKTTASAGQNTASARYHVNNIIYFPKFNNPQKPTPSFAGKLTWNGMQWVRQIPLYNGATEEMVPQELKDYVKNLVPRNPVSRVPYEDTIGYWLWGINETGTISPIGQPEDGTITQTVTVTSTSPAPVARIVPPAKKPVILTQPKAKPNTGPKPYDKYWEAKLNRLGYFCYQAIWDFQRDARDDGIKFYGQKVIVDGELGPQTKQAIDTYLIFLENPNCPKDYKVIQRALAAAKAKK